MTTQPGKQTTVVVAPPPTSNGDLHIGHLSGPYFGCDIFTRYHKMRGIDCHYVTGTDDNQSYVITTADRKKILPAKLVSESTTQIQSSLRKGDMAVDEFAPFDEGYVDACKEFLFELFKKGVFSRKQKPFYYSEHEEAFLYEGFVKGKCPHCYADSHGGVCESCGHPNNYTELLSPQSVRCPGAPVTVREATILVFELEQYREQLTSYYEQKRRFFRPRIIKLMDEVLANPLPDLPITYPGEWGMSATFLNMPMDQVVNAWVEGMPAVMYGTARALSIPEKTLKWDEVWLATENYQLVEFIGFDNSYFWGLTHVALLMAHGGKYVLPQAIITNEFYEFENLKFSTSKGHVIWVRDLLSEYSSDLVRFHLALTNPEYQRSNFTMADLDGMTIKPLMSILEDSVQKINLLYRKKQYSGYEEFVVSNDILTQLRAYERNISKCYSVTHFSPRAAAEMVLQGLAWLLELIEQHEQSSGDEQGAAACWLVLESMARFMTPLMPRLGGALSRSWPGYPERWPEISDRSLAKPVELKADSLGFEQPDIPNAARLVA